VAPWWLAPLGFNLFVLQGSTGHPMSMVARASLPFFLLVLSTAVIMAIFPEIALWLPGKLYD
jgi:C4-dicarboxylate transporter DctM subunit